MAIYRAIWGGIVAHAIYWTNMSLNWKKPSAHIKILRVAVGVDRPFRDKRDLYA